MAVISIKESWIATVGCRLLYKPAFMLCIELLLWEMWSVLEGLSCELQAVAFGNLVLIRISDRSRQKKPKPPNQNHPNPTPWPKTEGVKEKRAQHWNSCVCKVRHPEGHSSWFFPSVPWVFCPNVVTIFSVLKFVNFLRHFRSTVPVLIYLPLVLEVKLQVDTWL